MSVQPIFLLSQPRTGSTVVQRVLGAHEDIATVSEPWALMPLLTARRPGGYERGRLRSRYQEFTSLGIAEFSRALPGGDDGWYEQVREFGLGLYTQAARGKRFFLDKTPGYAPFAGELIRAFHDAKFIFLWRNPLSVVSSNRRLDPRGRWNAHNFRATLFDSVASLVAAYEANADRVVAVRYEDLVSGDDAWRRIAEYLGIEFDPTALHRFAEQPLDGALGDPDRHRYPALVSDRAERWRDTIDNPVRVAWCRRYLRWIGSDRLAKMGYDLDELLGDLASLDRGSWRRAGGDLAMLVVAAARESAKARLPPHHGDPQRVAHAARRRRDGKVSPAAGGTPVVDRRVGRVAWLRDYRRDPLAFLRGLADGNDVTRFRPGARDIYVVNAPELIRGVVASDQRAVVKGATIQASRRLLGNGLLSSEGDVHTRQRRLLQPAFHRSAHARFGDIALAETDRRLRTWRDGDTLELHLEARRIMIAALGESLFSTRLDDHVEQVVGAISDLQEVARNVGVPGRSLVRRLPTPSNRRLDRAEADIRAVVAGVIAERERLAREGAAPHDDFLALLVPADAEGGAAQARDEATTMLVAGHETTAGIIGWAGWLLATHPEAQEGLHAELHAELGGRAPGADDLDGLPFLHGVLAEALRLYPPIWAFSRMTVEPYSLGGTTVAPDSVLLMSPFVTQRDRRYFDDPDAFRPERWLDGTRPDRFAYFPFGGGSRMCIGEGFALTVAKLVLASIAADWALAPAGPEPFGEALVTLRPRGGVPVKLTLRRDGA